MTIKISKRKIRFATNFLGYVFIPKKEISFEEKSLKPPKKFIIIFGLIFAIALFNTVNDYGNLTGIKPFGFISEALAEAEIIRPARNSGEIAAFLKGADPIEDSYDRCDIIDPNVGITQVKNANETATFAPFGENPAGTNLAPTLDDGPALDRVDIATSYGNSYVLGLVVGPGAISNAAQFIQYANEEGVMPIIRLCYPSNAASPICGFRLDDGPEDIIQFYKDLSDAVGSSNFVATLGPNEPGTAGEMQEFRVSDYGTLVQAANDTATALQAYRVVNGGNMHLAPAAFNLSNAENDDAKKYIEGGLDASLYDYILGNAYDGAGTTSAYDQYLSTGQQYALKDYVDQNNLKIIFTETGSLTGDAAQMKLTVNQFCQDDSIEGFLFFRSYAEYENISPTPHPEFFTRSEMEDILSECSGAVKASSSNRDYAWANCEYDSCLYEESYDVNSAARMCGKELDNPNKYGAGSGAALMLKCGDGSDPSGNSGIASGALCYTQKIDTLEVAAPIKQFGNNSATGTPSNPYTPLCVEYANSVTADSTIDALNQFAGSLTGSTSDGSVDYPMPWLGSAINCAANLSTASFKNLSDIPEIPRDPSPGSLVSEALAERAKGGDEIIDERKLCINGKCIEKGEYDSIAKSFREYEVLDRPTNYDSPDVCSSSQMSYLNDPGNYIIGPELELSDEPDVVHTLSGNDLCMLYAKRKLSKDLDPYDFSAGGVNASTDLIAPDNLACFVKNEAIPVTYTGRLTGGIPTAGTCASFIASGFIQCQDGRVLGVGNAPLEMQKGDCAIDPQFQACINYGYDPNNPVFIKTNSFEDAPDLKIPGAYDALYRQYQRVQNALSQRGLKVVFRENIGWRLNVSTKIRDANREIGGDGPETKITEKPDYKYGEELSCNVPENLFDNEYFLARGNPIKTQYEYYDWLGYLDIIQELMVSYNEDQTLTAEEFVENPYFNSTQNLPETLTKEQLLLRSGSASIATGFPIYSCDDTEILKYDPDVPEDQRIATDLFPTCITYITDERFDDDLGSFLCTKGYDVEGECDPEEEPVCEEIDDNELPGATSTNNCSDSNCAVVNAKNDVEYPACPAGDVNHGICDDASQMNVLFGNGDPELPNNTALSCQARADAVGAGIQKQTITFLGVSFTVNVKVIPYLRQVESEVEQYRSAEGSSKYNFPSGEYTFSANGAFNARPIRGRESDENCAISNHSWGTALDLNASTNPFKDSCNADGSLTSDMPPEIVAAFEKYGFRWGGRYDTTPDPMHFEYCSGTAVGGSTDSDTDTDDDDSDDTDTSSSGSVTCPVASGKCLQGPFVGSHADSHLNAVDIYGSSTLVAPFDGQIVEVWNGTGNESWCLNGFNAGIAIFYQGTVNDETVTLFMLHISPAHYEELEAIKNQRVFHTGEFIANLASPTEPGVDNLTCSSVRGTGTVHTHMEFARNTGPWDKSALNNVTNSFSDDIVGFSYGLGCGQTANNACGADNIPDLNGGALQCVEPDAPDQPIDPGDYEPGVLSCNIDPNDTSDTVDFSQNIRQIEARVQAYNLDNNNSYTWLGNPSNPESGALRDQLIAHLGSEQAFRDDWEQRVQMTKHLIDGAVSRGINPRLAFTLWVEETGGSAVGGHALGCGITYLDEIPYGQGYDAMEHHLDEQLDCLERFINATNNFTEFMCTYSGEEPTGSVRNEDGVYVRSCDTNNFTNNPNFPTNVCKYYNYLPI